MAGKSAPKFAPKSASANRPVSKADIPDPSAGAAKKRRWFRLGHVLSMKQSAAVFLLGLIVVLTGSLSYIFYHSVNDILIQEIEKRAQAIAESVAESAPFGVLLSDSETLDQLTSAYMQDADVRYIWITDRDGKLIFPGAGEIEKRAFDTAVLKNVLNKGTPARVQANLGELSRGQESFSGYHVAVPVWHEMYDHILDADINDAQDASVLVADNRELIGMVQVGLSLESVEEQARLAMLRSGFLVLGITFLALVVAATLLHRWLEPLQVVTAMAKRIREKGYDAATEDSEVFLPAVYDRSAVHGRVDEIGQLYQIFNAMLQELTRHGLRLKEQKQYLKKMVDDQTAELMVAKEDAEAASRAKSVFLASMSHELRVPLNTVLGYTDMLQMDPHLPDDKRASSLSAIQKCSQDLLAVINDILDLSQLEADDFNLRHKAFNLKDCMNAAIASISHDIQQQQVRVATEIENSVIESDARIIRQMVINLMSNAVKFSHPGDEIKVHARLEASMLLIEVSDTGIGMTDDEIQQVQEPFAKGHAVDKARVTSGAGLGLALVRRFIALMDGSMHIYSDKGEGTVVRLAIPVRASTDQSP